MSLSDANDDTFTPVDIGALDSFEAEVSRKKDTTNPDYERFTLLIDPSQFETGKQEGFKALYSDEKDKKADPFKPLFAVKQKPGAEPESAKKTQSKGPGSPGPDPEHIVSASLEEKAAAQGFAKGYEDGCEKGRSEGYEEGFAKGREEGLAEGHAEGFAKGEAEGFAKGEADGVKKGEKASRKEASPILDSLQKSLSAVDTVLNDVVDAHEQDLVELVFKIAEKAVYASLDTTDDIVRQTVVDALKTLAQPRDIELSISPEDYEYIEMVKDSFFETAGSLQHVAVKSDPMVHRGGCRIETDTASVSTDPQAKLAAVYEAVKAAARQ